jgi:hypothetical protein
VRRRDEHPPKGVPRKAVQRSSPARDLPGVWVKLSDSWINADNVAFAEESGSWLILHFIRDRADRQRLPVLSARAWDKRTRKHILMGKDAEIMRRWMNGRSVLLVIPKAKDPDEF